MNVRIRDLLNDVLSIIGNIEELKEYEKYITFKHSKSSLISSLSQELEKLEYTIGSPDVQDLINSLESLNYKNIDDIKKLIEQIKLYSNELRNNIKIINYEILRNEINENKIGEYLDTIYRYDSLIDLLSQLVSELKRIRRVTIRNLNSITSVRYKHVRSIRDRVSRIENSLREYNHKIDRLLSSLENLLINLTWSYVKFEKKRRAYSIARSLYYSMLMDNRGISSTEFIDTFTGLKSVTANPLLDEIMFNTGRIFYEPKKMDIETLFARYPPVRPIVVRDDKGVIGSHLWLPEFIDNVKVHYLNEIDKLVKGKEYGDFFLLRQVTPIDVLNDTNNGFIKIEVEHNRGNKIYLKYGSQVLKSYIYRNLSQKEIESKYEELLTRNRKYKKRTPQKHYSPFNLSYVWYCSYGLGLSTDPFDFNCPFIHECPYKDVCRGKKWGRRRQIHPKVYPERNRFVEEAKLIFEADRNKPGTFEIIKGIEVTLTEEFSGITFSMPVSRVPVVMKFKKPFVKVLNATNVIGFSIPEFLLDHFIRAIIDINKLNEYNIKFIFGNETRKILLFDILLSKFYIYYKAKDDMNIRDIFNRRKKTIISDYSDFKNEVYDALKNSKRPIFNEFLNWIKTVLLHTLAHMFQMCVSYEFDIEMDELIYIYKVRGMNNRPYILVAENSNLGSIDIVDTLEQWSNDNHANEIDFVKKFFNEYRKILNKHNKELQKRFTVINDVMKNLSDEERTVVNTIRNTYIELIENGLVLDPYYFNMFLALNGNLDKLLENKIDQNNIYKYYNMLDDLVTMAIPTFCVDGCVNCVMFEKGCMHNILQPVMVSKNLVQLFMDFLSGKVQIYRPGNEMLKDLLAHLPRKSLVITSPYIDDTGLQFLIKLADRGIKIKLKTREDQLNKMPENLRSIALRKIDIDYIQYDHSKDYKIDDTLRIITSANLTLNSSSLNSFLLVGVLEQ